MSAVAHATAQMGEASSLLPAHLALKSLSVSWQTVGGAGMQSGRGDPGGQA